MNVLLKVRKLWKLELWGYILGENSNHNSNITRRIMNYLHSRKLGMWFDLIKTHVPSELSEFLSAMGGRDEETKIGLMKELAELSGMKKRLRRTIISDNSDKEFIRMSVLDTDIEALSCV